MLQRKSRLLLVLALAAICLPQTATQYVTSEVRRAGDKLACKCGACNNTVGTCPMLECHYSLPAREKIAEMRAEARASHGWIMDTYLLRS